MDDLFIGTVGRLLFAVSCQAMDDLLVDGTIVGCLNGVARGDQADIVCNECGTVVRTVPAGDLQRTFDEMELTLETASEMCPHCGKVNLFPGFSRIQTYICCECGEAVSLSD
jgi:hypothetical protein